jgi:hypothetical protein
MVFFMLTEQISAKRCLLNGNIFVTSAFRIADWGIHDDADNDDG